MKCRCHLLGTALCFSLPVGWPEQGTLIFLQRLCGAVVATPGSDCTGIQSQLFQSHRMVLARG